jgi:hypothetical protein
MPPKSALRFWDNGMHEQERRDSYPSSTEIFVRHGDIG